MNTIKDGENEYEVLTIDRISEITHAKLAGGKVRKCVLRGQFNKFIEWQHPSNGGAYINDFEDLGIQPLRLVPKEPVTFEGVVVKEDLGVRDDWVIYAPEEYVGKRFRCVEIVEEGA